MKIKGKGLTDTGLRRANNEDFIHVDNNLNLYIACDGVGGGGNGNIASKMAAETVADCIAKSRDIFEDFYKTGEINPLEELLKQAMLDACNSVYSASCKNHKLTGMASTMTAVIFVNNQAVLGHVGDSRLYVVRNNHAYVATEDHTLGQEVREQQFMSETQIIRNRFDHILNRSIGFFKSVEIDTLVFDILPGDQFILCTDGFHNYLRNPVQVIPMLDYDEISTVLKGMVEFAINGGGSDNISVIVIKARLEESVYMNFPSDKTQVLSDFSLLKGASLFNDLNFAGLNRALNLCQILEFKTADAIISQGDRLKGLYIVLSGEIALFKNDDDQGRLSKGATFGQPSLMTECYAPYSYVAQNDSSAIFISSLTFRRLCHSYPKLGVKLLENYIFSL